MQKNDLELGLSVYKANLESLIETKIGRPFAILPLGITNLIVVGSHIFEIGDTAEKNILGYEDILNSELGLEVNKLRALYASKEVAAQLNKVSLR